MNKLMNEVESQKVLLLTYEQAVTHRDSIVTNITMTDLSSRVANWINKYNSEIDD